MKIRILEDFNGRVEGMTFRFRKGQEIDINAVDADNMIRGHYAELIKPAVKVVEKPAVEKGIKVKREHS